MTKSADRRKMGKLERRNTLIAYSFLAPNFIGFVVNEFFDFVVPLSTLMPFLILVK